MRTALIAMLFWPSPTAVAEKRTPHIALVIDQADDDMLPLYERIARDIMIRADVSRYSLRPATLSNPIAKGRLLADLQTRDLVVTVGDGATDFSMRELEDQRICFIGAGIVLGKNLASATVGGVFKYNIDALLDAARRLKLRRLGLLYTPGYEAVVGWIRAGAARRGLSVSARRIARRSELPAAARDLFAASRAVWIVGDPALARGAGFELLREWSFAQRVPLIASDTEEVRGGALLSYQPSFSSLASAGAEAVDSFLAPGWEARKARLRPAPPGGAILVNGALTRRWAISDPGIKWRSYP